MPSLTLRPSHKAVAAYYESLGAFKTLGETHELAVKTAFATLLETAAKPFGWKLVPEHSMRAKGGKRIAPDGTLMDVFTIHHGHWEAKDSSDDLNKEIRAKIDKGYPTKNLLFWEPRRAVLYQHGEKVTTSRSTRRRPSSPSSGASWSSRRRSSWSGKPPSSTSRTLSRSSAKPSPAS